MAYLYGHKRLDKKEFFYIGIGTDVSGKYKRAHFYGRNKIWQKIVDKTDYEIIIIEDNLSLEEVCEREKYWIKKYGRIDNGTGTLTNLTDGGEGTLGRISSEETKQKMSISKIGKYIGNKNPMFGKKSPMFGKRHSAEARKKISLSKNGEKHHMFGKRHSIQSKKKISNALKGEKSPMFGKKMSEETRKKISEVAKKRFVSEETKQRLRTLRSGMKTSEETKKKMSEAAKKRRKNEKMLVL